MEPFKAQACPGESRKLGDDHPPTPNAQSKNEEKPPTNHPSSMFQVVGVYCIVHHPLGFNSTVSGEPFDLRHVVAPGPSAA